jgi:hypothetical protein
MDVQMVIPVHAADTPLKGHAVPVAVSRTNTSPLSFAAFRDRDLVNNLGRFAAFHNLRLDRTYLTSFLLHLLLIYQATCKPRGPVATRVKDAVRILETAWKTDIKDWSQNKDFTYKDAITGEVIWNTCFIQFINLILQPLQSQSAYVFFNEKGDISGQHDGPGIWRRCLFKSYSLDDIAKTFELQFQIDKQKKGLILDINDIQNFDDFGIYFQHPTHADCVLFNPFSCDEFAQPHQDSNHFKRRIISRMFEYMVSVTRKRTTDSTEVFLQQTFDCPFLL